ncbi:MAG: CGNR zinc finger domain-containing protein [Gaiellaceae bacterium]
MEPVDAIPYLGDREPAPGRLALVQRFVNTVDHEHGREMLSSPDRLAAVLRALGFDVASAGDGDLVRARAIRAALRTLALVNNGGGLDAAATQTLERAAAAGCLGVRFDGVTAVLAAAKPGVAGALAELVGIVTTAMTDGTWSRLKACQRDVCGWLFYDRSRNHSARWCQMAVCGNRTKTRAYRARRTR